jgi:hypothetical protein
MSYGPDSLDFNTYEIYSRQQRGSAWTHGIHGPLDATADDLPDVLKAMLNSYGQRKWVRWWLLVCPLAAREFRATCTDGIWKVELI